MTTILVESPHFDLVHDTSCDCLYATWHGAHGGAVTAENYELILQHVRLTHSTKLLSDGLADQNGWRELTGWLAQDCFLRLSQEGLLAIAWVLPRDTVALYDTQRLLAAISKPLIETFIDPEGAYRWLHKWPI